MSKKAERAARLCKADLTTGVVGEFPELQGVMGRYYALHDKEDAEVADAIRDHYKPVGPSRCRADRPRSPSLWRWPTSWIALTGFFAVGEKPTGSGDPFALAPRARLGDRYRDYLTAKTSLRACRLAECQTGRHLL